LELLSEYGLFLAKTVTIVAAILLIMTAAVANAMKQKKEGKGHIVVSHLNDELEHFSHEIRHAVEDEETLKQAEKADKKKKETGEKGP